MKFLAIMPTKDHECYRERGFNHKYNNLECWGPEAALGRTGRKASGQR
jgi:hypothetical protein